MRSHLLLILFVSLTVVVLAEDRLDETTAIKKIELLGGKVTRDDALPGKPVVGVTFFRRNKRFNGKFLYLLKSFDNLTTLSFSGTGASDADLTEIGQLKTLRTLNVVGTKITDASIKEMAQLTNLTELKIHGTQITEDGFQRLKASLPNAVVDRKAPDESQAIEKLRLLGGNIGSLVADDIAASGPVTEVHFQGFLDVGSKTKIEEVMSVLKEFPSLTSLSFGSRNFASHGLEITAEGLKEIYDLNNLTSLTLVEIEITSDQLEVICGLKNLTQLRLDHVRVTDAGLKGIGKLTNLTLLVLIDTQITDGGLGELGKLTNLTTLRIRDDQITEGGLKELQKLLPNLAKINQ